MNDNQKKKVCLLISVLSVLTVFIITCTILKTKHSVFELPHEENSILSGEKETEFYHPEIGPIKFPHVSGIPGIVKSPFTQGLFFTSSNGILIESSGGFHDSYLREFELKSGRTLRFLKLEEGFFAEGAAMVIEPDTLRRFVVLLTYKNGKILVYDYEKWELAFVYNLDYTGFGLTSNYNINSKEEDLKDFVKHQKVWITTGDAHLIRLKIPTSFKSGQFTILSVNYIKLNGEKRLKFVNELEYNHKAGTIFGNVWPTNYIVEVEEETGNCTSVWDFSSFVNRQYKLGANTDVMNGVAILPDQEDTVLITGKMWRWIHQVKLSKVNPILHEDAQDILNELGVLSEL